MASSAIDAPNEQAAPPSSDASGGGLIAQVKGGAGKLTDLGLAKAAELADGKKQEAVQQISAIVQVMRELEQSAGDSLGTGVGGLVGRGGDAIEALARTLEERNAEDVLAQSRATIVQHPGAALAIAALAGFAGGRILKGAMARSAAGNDQRMETAA